MRHQYSCQVCFGFGSVRLCSRTGSTAASSRRHRDNTALALLWVPPVAVVGGHVSGVLPVVPLSLSESRRAIRGAPLVSVGGHGGRGRPCPVAAARVPLLGTSALRGNLRKTAAGRRAVLA